MENLLKHETLSADDLWRAWEEKGQRHDKAVARRMKFLGAIVIFVLAAAFVFRTFMK